VASTVSKKPITEADGTIRVSVGAVGFSKVAQAAGRFDGAKMIADGAKQTAEAAFMQMLSQVNDILSVREIVIPDGFVFGGMDIATGMLVFIKAPEQQNQPIPIRPDVAAGPAGVPVQAFEQK
jgi:hypothetical protein